jgi:MFS family permease
MGDDDHDAAGSRPPASRPEPTVIAERVGPFEVVESVAALESVESGTTGPPFSPSLSESPTTGIDAPPMRRPRVFGIGERLWAMTGEVDPTPLVILFLLYFFDEFDTGAFNTLAPNIKASFGLTDQTFGLVVVLNLAIVLLFAVPVGHLGDRMKRVTLVVIGALVAGTFSFLTGVVTTVGLLLVVRVANGMGRLVNDPIHNSLLADWYKPFDRPRVFAAHANAVQLGSIAGAALSGLVAALFGWEWAFMLLAIPILIVSLWATRLKEPERGATDGGATVEPPLPFRKAVGVTMRIRTLRRLYLAATIVGGGLVPLAVLGPLFLEQVFGLGPFWRGLVVSAGSGATYFGMRMSGRWTQQWLVKGMGVPLHRSGVLLIAVGFELAALSLAPNIYVYVVIVLAASFTAGVFLPALITTQAFVAPARVRSLVFSFSSIFFVIGAVVFFASPLGSLSDTAGIRWGMLSSAPFWAVGGLIALTAVHFVTDDAAKAFAPD